MLRLFRRVTLGGIAGIAASLALLPALGHLVPVLLMGAVLGAGYAVLTGPTPEAYIDNMFTAGAYGLPLWAVISVIALPLFSGQIRDREARESGPPFFLFCWVVLFVL